MRDRSAVLKAFGVVLAAWAALTAPAGETKKGTSAKVATNAPPSFAVVCSNAWVKGVTEKSAVGYRTGEEIRFTLTLAGVTNAVPAGKYFFQWKRTGDDGVVEEGRADLTKKTFSYTTKLEKPGFVRLSAKVITADGQPFLKQEGSRRTPLVFEGGAGVAVDEIAPRPEADARAFDAWVKEIRRKVAAVPFKKVERAAVAEPGDAAFALYTVSVPCVGARPVTGYLVVPVAAGKGERFPGRVLFTGCGFAKAQPLPSRYDKSPEYVTFVTPFDGSEAARAAEGYYADLAAHAMRAVEYLKTIPEWDGKNLVVQGGGVASLPALIAGGLGIGVTRVATINTFLCEHPKYDALSFARRIPATCRVDQSHAALGDDTFRPADAAQLWNVLVSEKTVTWVQGAQAWTGQRGFRGRDILWEKLRPVAYRGMSADHCQPVRKGDVGFLDYDLALRDKVVFEVIVDPADTKSFNPAILQEMVNYAESGHIPFTLYVVLPCKRVKDKVWTEFLKIASGAGSLNYHVYLDAGMDLPKPEKLPWYNVADLDGVLRYSGPDLPKATAAKNAAVQRIPEADPVFAYAPVKLFKADLAAAAKAKRTGQKLYKYIEAEGRKARRTDAARAAEAEHLLHGLRQACDRRLADLMFEAQDRPGRAWMKLGELLAEWPDRAADFRVAVLEERVKNNPEIEKVAKLEAELLRLRDWKPIRTMDVKKRDAQVAIFRRKVEKYVKGKNTSLQGEALLIQTEFDNPPPDPAQGN